MTKNLSTLFEFLGAIEREVEGHAGRQPSKEAEVLIRKVFGLKASPEERRRVCELLRSQPGWIEWFAEQIKLSRKVAPAGS